jgi:hypothetical protein
LRQAYFEPGRDLVVWAPRGGGKTRLGAAATLLDLLHKPGVSVRILGGSLDQSLRMWEHLMPDVERLAREDRLGRVGSSRRIRMNNGSEAAVLTQSQRAVRGLRVQKLRCDEVEMFDQEVWEAAQLVTRSKEAGADTLGVPGGGGLYVGAVEALSTMHRVGGLMEGIVERAEGSGTRVLRWCLMEVLERCPAERICAACPLHEDCQGRAKEHCNGFVPIDDAIAMKRRVSKETWEAEMMCRRPARTDAVFRMFEVEAHVCEQMPGAPADRAEQPGRAGLYCGIDFGFKNPFVCLWVRRDAWGRSFVIDEYVQDRVELPRHIEAIQARERLWGPVRKIGCDPAGSARNEQTGESSANRLRAAGFKVSCRGSMIQEGLEMIRAGLASGTGEVSLFIHPRCRELIRAMRAYRYGPGRAEVPAKDGPDHLIDALRYYYINRDSGEVTGARY